MGWKPASHQRCPSPGLGLGPGALPSSSGRRAQEVRLGLRGLVSMRSTDREMDLGPKS